MADWAITFTNAVGTQGPGATSKWNILVWGTDYWGAGSQDLFTRIEKYLSNDITPDGATFHRQILVGVANTFTNTEDLSSETLRDPEGYYYVFTYPSTNAENRSTATFTSQANTVN